jgi:protein kinase C substrate 80K-H
MTGQRLFQIVSDGVFDLKLKLHMTTPSSVEAAKRAHEKAETALEEVQTKLVSIEGKLSDIKSKLELFYGPDDEFAVLDPDDVDEKPCWEYRSAEYVYEICPYGKVKQKDAGGGWLADLGFVYLNVYSFFAAYLIRFEFIRTFKTLLVDFNSKSPAKMVFDSGTQCWNGPARSMTVKFRCGTGAAPAAGSSSSMSGGLIKILSVTEPEKCEYVAEVETPLVCNTDGDGNSK